MLTLSDTWSIERNVKDYVTPIFHVDLSVKHLIKTPFLFNPGGFGVFS